MIDPYDLLGIGRDADDKAVRAAYRTVAKDAHPDSGGDVERFAKLQAAYELLKDPVRRKIDGYGLTAKIEPAHLFPTVEAAVDAFRARPQADWTPVPPRSPVVGPHERSGDRG